MAPPIQVDDGDETKGDMTPMIDVIFLLLIFFILTTKFVTAEKVISSLLPTDKGQAPIQQKVVEQLDDVNVCIFPAAIQPGLQPSAYDRQWKDNMGRMSREVLLRVGKRGQAIKVDGGRLGSSVTEVCQAEVDKVVSHIDSALEARDKPGTPRKDQPAVVIHCFSGLPWKYALVAYDAVRAFEARKGGTGSSKFGGLLKAEELKNAREVDFAPPRIRNYHTWEHGNEIWEIINMK